MTTMQYEIRLMRSNTEVTLQPLFSSVLAQLLYLYSVVHILSRGALWSIWGNCLVPHKKIRDDWFYWPVYAAVIRATFRAWSHAFVWPSLFFPAWDPALIWIWYDSKVPIMYIHARPCSLSAVCELKRQRGEKERRGKIRRRNISKGKRAGLENNFPQEPEVCYFPAPYIVNKMLPRKHWWAIKRLCGVFFFHQPACHILSASAALVMSW